MMMMVMMIMMHMMIPVTSYKLLRSAIAGIFTVVSKKDLGRDSK